MYSYWSLVRCLSELFDNRKDIEKVMFLRLRNNLLLNNLVASVFGLLIFIPNFFTFLVFRFGQGVCVGIFSGLAPLIIR